MKEQKKAVYPFLREFMVSVALILICIVAIVILIVQNVSKGNEIHRLTEETAYKTVQERTSVNFEKTDETYLLYIAQVKGGTTEERAYTILVTLNRHLALGYDIPTLVELELGEVEVPTEFVLEYATMEAMHIIQKEDFDNSNGSLTYKK